MSVATTKCTRHFIVTAGRAEHFVWWFIRNEQNLADCLHNATTKRFPRLRFCLLTDTVRVTNHLYCIVLHWFKRIRIRTRARRISLLYSPPYRRHRPLQPVHLSVPFRDIQVTLRRYKVTCIGATKCSTRSVCPFVYPLPKIGKP